MHDRSTIELPGHQNDLVQALRKATTGPLVCVLINGGAVAMGPAKDLCDAVLDLWVPGQEGGAALADVLFGDYSPAGRAPVTFYSKTADLPDMGDFNEYPHLAQDGKNASNGTTYRYYQGWQPDFRFGDGLSYTTFGYGGLSAPESLAHGCDSFDVSVTVTNTGEVVSDEVVQVYLQTPESTVPSPTIRLAAFTRVRDIAPGKSVQVSLTITPESHAVVYEQGNLYQSNLVVEAGKVKLFVGGSQPFGKLQNLVKDTVVKETAALNGCKWR